MLTVTFGESTISRTQVQLWHNRFKEGREDVNDDEKIKAVKKMIYHEFLPQGRTINKKYYLEVMRRLRKAIRQKSTEL